MNSTIIFKLRVKGKRPISYGGKHELVYEGGFYINKKGKDLYSFICKSNIGISNTDIENLGYQWNHTS